MSEIVLNRTIQIFLHLILLTREELTAIVLREKGLLSLRRCGVEDTVKCLLSGQLVVWELKELTFL